ncbi:MAG: hypothetical protein ABIT38_04035, partial [Gemmatimonadaceae bacterium]
VRSSQSTFGADTRRETEVRVDTIQVGAKRLFEVLPGVFASLNLKTATIEEEALNVISENTMFRRTFDGERLSHFLTCGSSAAGNNADLYFVSLRLQSWAERVGDSTAMLHTAVRASARPADNGASNAVPCASTGRIEKRIRQLVALNALAKQ